MRNLKVEKFVMIKFLIICILSIPLLYSCKPSPDDGISQADREKMFEHIISADDAVKLYKAYTDERVDPLKDSLISRYGDNFKDTRLVSIDLATIKAYIQYIEESSEALKVNAEGLNFYFGVYAKGEEGNNQNHQTFFIAPSTSKDNKQFGYTIDYTDGTNKIVYLNDLLKGSNSDATKRSEMEQANMMAFFTRDNHGLILNRGTGSPPNGNE